MSDIIAEITASSAEQSDNIGQISQSVTQLDQMTQQNAALVEESTAASESLREQAHQLTSAVSQFKLRDGSAVLPVARAAAQTASAAPAARQGPRRPVLQIR